MLAIFSFFPLFCSGIQTALQAERRRGKHRSVTSTGGTEAGSKTVRQTGVRAEKQMLVWVFFFQVSDFLFSTIIPYGEAFLGSGEGVYKGTSTKNAGELLVPLL